MATQKADWFQSKDDIKLDFVNGWAETPVLTKTGLPNVKVYRGELKAGASFNGKHNARVLTTYIITSGTGYIITPQKAYNIKEISYFFNSLEDDYTFHAVTDLVYTKFDLILSDYDLMRYNMNNLALPLFRQESELLQYKQNVEIGKTVQKSVVVGKQMIRLVIGSNWADDASGFYEIGHNAVAQYNVCHGGCDMDFTVDGVTIRHQAGDLSYVKAGLPHGSVARKGKCVQYIYYEVYVQEKDFLKVFPEGPFEDTSKKH